MTMAIKVKKRTIKNFLTVWDDLTNQDPEWALRIDLKGDIFETDRIDLFIDSLRDHVKK